MPAPAHLLLMAAAGGAAFDPTQIGWHSLFWASGPSMLAQGYSEGASVGTWPNETAEADATEATNKPTWDASHASYNSKPVVLWGSGACVLSQTFNSAPTYPISVVCIANCNGNSQVFFDGLDSSHRQHLFAATTNYQMFAGGSGQTGGTKNNSPHLFVATYDGSTGNETLSVDGAALAINANAGSHQATGFRLGNYLGDAPSYYPLNGGNIALFGVYSGTITSDPLWSTFKAWVTSFYGISVS